MVFKNLKNLIPVENELYEKLKGTYRKSWFSNNMIQQTAGSLFSELKKMGICPVLLKGIHLINSYYDDTASRPLGDADFLVSWEQAASVDGHLRSSGWKLQAKPRYFGFAENSMLAAHGFMYINEKGHVCDLHWNIMAHRLYPDADKEMVKNSVKIAFMGDTFGALCPEDLVLHLLEHGAYGSPVPSIRWVQDVLTVLKKEKDIDWDRFLTNTLHTNLEVPVKVMLEYLLNTFNAEQIAYPLKRLAAFPASKMGKALYRSMLPRRNPIGRSINEYRKIYFQYRLFITAYKKESLPGGISGFIRCLKFRWDVKSNILFPFVFTVKFFQKFVRYILRFLKQR